MSKRIRVRHSGGSAALEIPPGATAGEVARLVRSVSASLPPPEGQIWKAGYPPKPFERVGAEDAFPASVDMLVVSAAVAGEGGTVDFATGEGANKGGGDRTATAKDMAAAYFSDTDGSAPPLMDPEGVVIRRVVDADNACLFNSVGYVLRKSRSDSARLRGMIARAVLGDPHTYTSAFLEKDPAEYADWIKRSESWGGQIELHIFSTLFRIEIAAFDVARDRYDVYGGGEGFGRRVMVMYDGIHYDALAFAFDPSMPEETDVTVFSPRDESVMEKARALCREQHRKKEFTDTSSFTLRCVVCQMGLEGAAEAQEHAQQTGHANFAEFR